MMTSQELTLARSEKRYIDSLRRCVADQRVVQFIECYDELEEERRIELAATIAKVRFTFGMGTGSAIVLIRGLIKAGHL